ncbi:hypothetical protein CPB84DRAFT_1846007 [Gymnopilus junonius]|uniref:Transmembrane protein n=1 Tax=Gymnopilus junonius TaxID=109634 RepID=A0A9P5NQG3_GYMJU|nr:hypothetical protein CPB84DRAFT_1846007 [Gymnopilus junonius]
MAESTSLLANESTPASKHFKHALKVLTIVVLFLTISSLPLLITNYIILEHAPFSWAPWTARRSSIELITVMIFSLFFTFISTASKFPTLLSFVIGLVLTGLVIAMLIIGTLPIGPIILMIFLFIFAFIYAFDFPILLNMIVDVVLTTFTIVNVVRFIGSFPESSWCRSWIQYPSRKPISSHPKCGHWKTVSTVLMGIIAAFSILLATVFVIRLLLRSIALYRTKFWKRGLYMTLPTGEITFQISLKMLKKEGAKSSTESEALHGPVHL